MYLSGLGCRNIIKKLCEDEEVKPLVENWDNSRISRMIKNPKYCGDLVQGLSYTDDFLSKSRKNKMIFQKYIILKIIIKVSFQKIFITKLNKKEKEEIVLKKVRSQRNIVQNMSFLIKLNVTIATILIQEKQE